MNNRRNRQWMFGGLLMVALPALTVGAEPILAEIGRNPFERVLTGACDDDREKLADWQLQGIVRGRITILLGYSGRRASGKNWR